MKVPSGFNINLYFLAIIIFLGLSSCKTKLANNVDQSQIFKDSPGTIYLVRHAEKLKSEDRNPDLSKMGQSRAQNLAILLQDKGINIIYSTDYLRTKNTAKPLADKLGISVKIYDPREPTFAVSLKNHHEDILLVVGHSNTTPTLANQLIGKQMYDQLGEMEYDKLFKLILKNGTYSCKLIEF